MTLEKLLQDIQNETSIWAIEKLENTPQVDAAWDRVGAKNQMSANDVKLTFKVLSKKYETEKLKPNTNWKLFKYLKFLDVKNESEVADAKDDFPDNADLEVQQTQHKIINSDTEEKAINSQIVQVEDIKYVPQHQEEFHLNNNKQCGDILLENLKSELPQLEQIENTTIPLVNGHKLVDICQSPTKKSTNELIATPQHIIYHITDQITAAIYVFNLLSKILTVN